MSLDLLQLDQNNEYQNDDYWDNNDENDNNNENDEDRSMMADEGNENQVRGSE